MRAFLLIILCCSPLFGWTGLSAQEAPNPPPVFISGGRLVAEIQLAPVDADAFVRRLGQPQILNEPPSPPGPAYEVRSSYWALSISEESPISEVIIYYPDSGYVRAAQDGEDIWLVLDFGQQAILKRYIRLAEAGLIEHRPGIVEVLTAAAQDEVIQVQMGSRVLESAEAAQFWRGASPLVRLDSAELETEIVGEEVVWLLVSLPEGRAIQLRYLLAEGLLLDALGIEVYTVPSGWLDPVLGAEAPKPGDLSGVAGRLPPQSSSPGSVVWWPVMIGGGIGLIAAAVFARRRLTAPKGK